MTVTISDNKLTQKTFIGLKFNQIECTPEDLVGYVEEGRVFTYNQKETSFTHKGHNYRSSYSNTEVVIVDIDKVDDDFTTMTEKVAQMEYKPYLIHTTYSNQTAKKDNKYCYHLIYVLDAAIYGADTFDKVYQTLTYDYQELVDKKADDCNRMMYSSNKCLDNFKLHVFGDITSTVAVMNNLKYTTINPNNIQVVSGSSTPTVDLSGIDAKFLKELQDKQRSTFVKKYRYGFFRETQVEYDEWGYADLTHINYYKVFDKHIFKNGEVSIKKITNGHRANQLMVDGFNFLKCNPDMTIEGLISSLVTEVYYYYDNNDNEFTNYKIIEIAKYCLSHPNNVKPTKKKFKIDTKLYRDRFFVKGIKAVSKAKKIHTDSIIADGYDFKLSLKENSENLGIEVRRLKKFMIENGVEIEEKVSDEELLALYDSNLSVRKNAKIMGCTPSKVQRLEKKYHLK